MTICCCTTLIRSCSATHFPGIRLPPERLSRELLHTVGTAVLDDGPRQHRQVGAHGEADLFPRMETRRQEIGAKIVINHERRRMVHRSSRPSRPSPMMQGESSDGSI
jgi:hypothetical protein